MDHAVNNAVDNSDADVFLASLQGNVVQCSTVEDAIAIKTADSLLRDGGVATSSELDRLADVVTRYGCLKAGELLSHRASRQRAAEFLVHTAISGGSK